MSQSSPIQSRSRSMSHSSSIQSRSRSMSQPFRPVPSRHAPSRKPSIYFMDADGPKPAKLSPKRCIRCKCRIGIVTISTDYGRVGRRGRLARRSQ